MRVMVIVKASKESETGAVPDTKSKLFADMDAFNQELVKAGIMVSGDGLKASKFGKRNKIMSDQLPEALDFLARILRAGHSLSTGLQMMGTELPDPLAAEFRRCYDQHSLGQPLEDCLRDMATRVLARTDQSTAPLPHTSRATGLGSRPACTRAGAAPPARSPPRSPRLRRTRPVPLPSTTARA